MQIFKVALVTMLVLVSADGGKLASKTHGRVTNGRASKTPAPAQLGGFPFEIFPFREVFVTTEGEAFLVELSVRCPAGAVNDSEFKLLEPTPKFVSLSAPLRGENDAVVLLVVNPQRGDAGFYEFKASMRVCNGRIGDIPIFRVKVKKAKKG
jgi:hypothetical protein